MTRQNVELDAQSTELKLVITAPTLEELFAEAGREVARQWGGAEGERGQWQRLVLEAPDRASLLVDWLNELIGRSEVEQRAFDEIRILALTENRLEAEIRGGRPRLPASPLKAATYHGLQLVQIDGYWKAEVMLDV
jgi:SHS2 domain-containing protein